MEHKCIRDSCPYNKNTNIKNNGGLYCCKQCKTNGLHGLFCQKNIDIKTTVASTDEKNPFQKILCEQINNRAHYVGGPNPPKWGISVNIKDNTIVEVINHTIANNKVRISQYIKLLENTLKVHRIKDCYVNIQIRDTPVKGYFNFCRNVNSKTGVFLLPNHRFQQDDTKILDEKNITETYNEEKALIISKNIPFETKQSAIYTSSSFQPARTNYYSYALNHLFCKGVLYYNEAKSPVPPAHFLNRLAQKNLVSTTFVPFIAHTDYKYTLYTDGNTLSDRMRLLLCLNSVIIRKSSTYEEFYTYKLSNYINYIEYNEEEELEQIYQTLENDKPLCNKIIDNNKQFIETTLTYENILQYTADLINGIC